MSLNPLLTPEFTRPYVEQNRTPTDAFQYFLTLLEAYINRFGGSSVNSPSPVELADGEEIQLETGKAGYGECLIGDVQEHSFFTFTSTGTVALTDNTANVVTTDTASKLCIYWDATNSTVNIKNNLGSTLNLIYTVKYNDV